MLERPKGPPLFQSKRDVDAYLCALTPNARLLFLAHALQFALETARAEAAPVVLFNSYYYKYFATERALGADAALARDLAAAFPSPDLVLELRLPLETAAGRKKALSRYECGLAERPDDAAFRTFQTKAAHFWQEFDRSAWVQLDAQLSPETLAQKALSALRAAQLLTP